MAVTEWRLSLKLIDQPSVPKSVLQFPGTEPGDVPPGQYRVATLKQLVSVQLPDAIPDPELIGGWITTALFSKVFFFFFLINACVVHLFAEWNATRNLYLYIAELVYCGRKLRDELTLDSYGIQSGSTVHILRKSWPEPEIQSGGPVCWHWPIVTSIIRHQLLLCPGIINPKYSKRGHTHLRTFTVANIIFLGFVMKSPKWLFYVD